MTVITIGEIKYWSEQLFSFSMCPYSRSFVISLLTRSCRLMGTLLPFWCFGWKFLWNLDLTIWIFDRPIREMSCGNCFAMRVLNGHWGVIGLTLLPSFEFGVWVTEIPRASNKSPPISGFSPSRNTTNSASSICHPLLAIGACIIPITFMGSFANVSSSWGGCCHQPSGKRGIIHYFRSKRLGQDTTHTAWVNE